MSARKKLVLSITLMCVVTILAITGLIAVFASANQSLTSTVSVTYVAQDVSAKVKANYIIGNTSTAMLGENEKGEIIDELVFTPSSEEGGSLAPEGDILLEGYTKVVFEYIFTNTSTTFNISLNLFSVPTDTNMDVTYMYSDTQITNYSTFVGNDKHEPFVEQRINANATANATKYVYIIVGVHADSDDAFFEGEFIWAMHKADAED